MATDVQVHCINKRDRYNPHERIHAIGGVDYTGKRWWLPEEQAIASIKSGQYTFYTRVNGYRADVRIGWHLGREYLTTEPDGQQPNTLLSLPECPR